MGFDLFFAAFVSLFVVVDPFGTAAVFISLTKGQDKDAQFRIALKAVVLSILLLVLFGLAGHALLTQMGVSLDALKVAGGALLFVTAFRMIMGYHDPDQLQSEKSTYGKSDDIAVFPLAIPLLAGPGTMTAALMFITSTHSLAGYGQVFLAIILVQLIALVCLASAGRLARFFGDTGSGIIARVMGVLLAAMAVQFIADGGKALMVS